MNKGLIYAACIKGNSFRHCFISFPHHWRAYISPASVPTFLVASESGSLVVSWAGHTHDQESEDEAHVYLSTKLLQVNGFTDGEPVIIRQISCPAPCSNASAVVIRDSDWEELALNIQVAQNAFLTQFRVIKKDQIFPLWLEGGVYIFMKVISFSPPTTVSLLQLNTEVKVLPVENVATDVPLSLKPAIREDIEIIQKTKEQNMLQLIYYIFILLGYSLNKLRLFPKEDLSVKLKIVNLPLKYFDCRLHILPKLLMMHPSLVLISWKILRNTKYESSEYFIAKISNNCPDKKSKTNDNFSSETYMVVVVVWEKLIKRIRIEPYFKYIDNILQHKTCISSKNLHTKMTANKDGTVVLEALESDFISSKNFILDVTVKDPTHINSSVISTTLFSTFAEINQYCPVVIINKTVLTLDLEGEHRDIYLCTRDDYPVVVKKMKGSPLYFHIDLSLSKRFPNYNNYMDEKQDLLISFSDNHVNEEIFKILCSSLERDIYLENHVLPNFSLLQGSKGSGKTTLVKNLVKRFSVYPYFVYCKIVSFKILKGKKVDSVQKLLKEFLSDVLAFRPSLLILDDIDCISNMQSSEDIGTLSAYMNYMAYMVKTLLSQLIESLKVTAKTSSSIEAPVIVIATCVSRKDVHEFLTSPKGNHIFPKSFHIPPLSELDKLSVLQYYLESRRKIFIEEKNFLSCKIPQEKILNFCNETLIPKLDCMTLLDIKNISQRVFIEAKERWLYDANFVDKYSDYSYSYDNSDIEKALNGYISSSMKAFGFQFKIEQQNRIGGLHDPRQMLEEMILWPSKYPKIFSQTTLRLRSGILLYGPPGCGKSLLAQSFNNYHHINFITVKGPELLSKYIGQSEKAVRDAFERASSAKPCILFFDEFESVAPRRGHDNTGVTDRVVNQLLTQMDGVEGLSGVFILAATSRPELIDPALLRPGRLDKGVYCPIPNSGDREEILRVLCEDINLDPEVNIKEIATKTEGYSGADLKNILSTALIKTAQSSIGKFLSKDITDLDITLNKDINNLDFENVSVDENIHTGINKTSPQIRLKDIYDALAEVKPSVGVKERLRFDELDKRFSQNKKGSSFTRIKPGKRETLA